MESDENKVEMTGTVRDWEERYTPKGILTIKMNIKVHEQWDGGSRDSIIPCDLFGKSAEYLKKKMDDGQVRAGTVVRCVGSLGSYENKAHFLNLTFKCWKCEVVSNSGAASRSVEQEQPSDEDVPF